MEIACMKKYLMKELDLDTIVDILDELPMWSAPFGLKLLDAVEYRPNMSVLDIGCGTGFPLVELAMRLGESSTVYGIDPWKAALVRTRKKIDQYKMINIRLIEGVAESLPFDDHSIELIVSNNGINNVSDMDTVFSECSRVLKDGGQFVMTMNLDTSMTEFYRELEAVLSDLHFMHEIELMHQHIYHKRRPLKEIVPAIVKRGFLIKDLEQDQFNYTFTDGTALLNHHFIRLAFMD
jgi:arsenite methyltransferase